MRCWGPGWSWSQTTAIRTCALVHGHCRYFRLPGICLTKNDNLFHMARWCSSVTFIQLGEAQQTHNNHAFNRLRRSKELRNHPSYIWGTPILGGTCRKPRKAWNWKENLHRLLRLRNWLGVGWAGFFPVSLLMVLLVYSAVSLYKEDTSWVSQIGYVDPYYGRYVYFSEGLVEIKSRVQAQRAGQSLAQNRTGNPDACI